MRAIVEKTYGRDSEYRQLHYWVEKQLGKPQHCVACGTTEKRRYAWANISGEYLKDVKDWQRLCYPCHMVGGTKATMKTNNISCRRGHPRAEYSVVIKNGTRVCMVCRRIKSREYYYRDRTKILKKWRDDYAAAKLIKEKNNEYM